MVDTEQLALRRIDFRLSGGHARSSWTEILGTFADFGRWYDHGLYSGSGHLRGLVQPV